MIYTTTLDYDGSFWLISNDYSSLNEALVALANDEAVRIARLENCDNMSDRRGDVVIDNHLPLVKRLWREELLWDIVMIFETEMNWSQFGNWFKTRYVSYRQESEDFTFIKNPPKGDRIKWNTAISYHEWSDTPHARKFSKRQKRRFNRRMNVRYINEQRPT